MSGATFERCGNCLHFGGPRDGRVAYREYCRVILAMRWACQTCPRWEARRAREH